MSPRRSPASAGFSLIELMVAMVVLALLILLSSRLLQESGDLRALIVRRVEPQALARGLFDLVADELAGVVVDPDTYGITATDDRLGYFTRRRAPANGEGRGLRYVVYEREGGAPLAPLVRRTYRVEEAGVLVTDGEAEVLYEHVAAFAARGITPEGVTADLDDARDMPVAIDLLLETVAWAEAEAYPDRPPSDQDRIRGKAVLRVALPAWSGSGEDRR